MAEMGLIRKSMVQRNMARATQVCRGKQGVDVANIVVIDCIALHERTSGQSTGAVDFLFCDGGSFHGLRLALGVARSAGTGTDLPPRRFWRSTVVDLEVPMRRLAIPALILLAAAVSACGQTIEQRAATGAVAGAVVAGPVGAAVGGAAGAAVGHAAKPD